MKILVVDDDASICRDLKRFLEHCSHEVEVAYEGAVALAKAGAFKPDLILLDIGLPGMSGIDILKTVKAKFTAVRVIVVSGNQEEELKSMAFSLGAENYILKPFKLVHLLEQIQNGGHS
jgi:DNA-binding response OmpR family regulator